MSDDWTVKTKRDQTRGGTETDLPPRLHISVSQAPVQHRTLARKS